MDEDESVPLLQKCPVVPKDRLYLVYSIFYLLGVGTLLPWNFFSNAKQYFSYKLRNVSIANESNFDDIGIKTDLQVMFESYITIAAMVPNILFMFLNTAVTKLIKLNIRVVVAAITMIAMFLLAIVFTQLNTDDWQSGFFIATILSIVFMNAASAVLQGGIFGLSGLFPREYTQAVMAGMAMGGTIAALANIIVLALGKHPTQSGFGYFIIAEVFLVMALIGYLSLPLMKYARHHYPTDGTRKDSVTVNESSISENNSSFETSNETPGVIFDDEDLQRSRRESVRDIGTSFCSVFRKIWVFGFSVFLVFFVTLCCYPAVNSNIISNSESHPLWAKTYFTPVTCFLAFNFCDWIGRSIAGPIQWPKEDSPLIPLLSALRVGFIPLFMMCNVQPRGSLIPLLFTSDWIPCVLMIIFALSNGYLGTLCMMYGPRLVDQGEVEMAGSMMAFFLSSGLGLGSLMSILLMLIVKHV